MPTMKATGPGSEHWSARAACRDADPELFFPVGHSAIAELQAAIALQICAICPVRRRCLRWALDHDEISGVWGGTTEAERIARRRLGRGFDRDEQAVREISLDELVLGQSGS
jgi:WhiB family transcriptional regulator, redox-sensing transcriptional regulator